VSEEAFPERFNRLTKLLSRRLRERELHTVKSHCNLHFYSTVEYYYKIY